MFSLLKSSVSKTCVINGICNNKFNLIPVRESRNELRKSLGRGYAPTSRRKLALVMLPASSSNTRNLLIHRENKRSKFERRKYDREMIILKKTVESNIKNKLLLDVKKENKIMEAENFIASSPEEYRDLLKLLFDTMAMDQYIEEPSTYEMIKRIVSKKKLKYEESYTELVLNYFFVRLLYSLYFNCHANFGSLRDILFEDRMSYERFVSILTSRDQMSDNCYDFIYRSDYDIEINSIYIRLKRLAYPVSRSTD